MEGEKQKKVQNLYRRIKHQNRADIKGNEIGRFGTLVILLWLLLLVLNALFDI
ncbi:hypothetical protein [Bacillus infantis]|uniref:hypothetical protein n=1 Tax=Bacillus infantis TaxID=324767 RepID=UPI0020A13262|nr:hypothetical protein [Bacillus infantis]MCP1157047.1 hypothetical protein [Bacillus infantis]